MRSFTAAPARARANAGTLAQQALACTFFAALVAVFARIAIYTPLTPVPFNLQPMAIMLTGMFLGSGPAFFALLEYVVAGALGAPLFANGNGGLAYMLATPSLGYILSYPLAAWAIGRLSERSRLNFRRLLLAGLAGLLVIYAGGYFYILLALHREPVQTLQVSVLPFVPFDVVKVAIAAGVASTTAGSWFAWRKR